MTNESIKLPVESNNSLAPAINDIKTKFQIKCYGHCLRQDKLKFKRKQKDNIYITYDINLRSYIQQDANVMLNNFLFGVAKLTKNANGIDCTTLAAETEYSINLLRNRTNLV